MTDATHVVAYLAVALSGAICGLGVGVALSGVVG
jgi:hypothetical protein